MRKAVDFVESFIVAAIFLVLVQTFLEDFSILSGWSWETRKIFVVSGFIFDSIFTVEFLIRYFSALSRKQAGRYFLEGRGWIDFLASVPLLLLNSGPAVLSLVMGGGVLFGMGNMLNILKIVKVIRIARILRLLRIIKIFKSIKYISSPMAQRHITTINTITITAFVFTLFFYTILAGALSLPSHDGYVQRRSAVGVNSFLKAVQEDGRSGGKGSCFRRVRS